MPTKRARKRTSRKVTPESLVAARITDYLKLLNIRFFRNQVGMIHRRAKVGEDGMADYTAFVPVPKEPGKFFIVHIEAKAARGTQSPAQKSWAAEIVKYGHHYIVAKDFEDVAAWLMEHGVIPKRTRPTQQKLV